MSRVSMIKLCTPNLLVGIDQPRSRYICDRLSELSEKDLNNPTNIELRENYLVNVHRKLYRARPFKEINPNTYRCILIDSGEIEVVQKQNFYKIPNEEIVSCSAAAKVYRVLGIKPTKMVIREYGAQRQANIEEGESWDRRAYKFSARLFQENNGNVTVQYIRETFDKAMIKLTICHGGKAWDYAELLVSEKYAVFFEESPNLDDNYNDEKCGVTSALGSLENESISNLLIESNSNNMEKSVKSNSTESINANSTPECGIDNENSFNTSTNNEIKNVKSITTDIVKLSLTSESSHVSSNSISQNYISDLERLVKRWQIKRVKHGDKIVYRYERPTPPITSYQEDRYLAPFIKAAMDHYKSKTLLNLQAYMIPAILRGISVLGIAPKEKGKSMGILMPILQMVISKNLNRGQEFNPLAIIICSSWKNVKKTVDSANKLLEFYKVTDKIRKPKIIPCYAGVIERRVMMTILNGCEILVTTPPPLLRLLKSHSFFKLDCLEFLCFDDIEVLISNHLDELREILFYKQTASIERGYEPQRVITATHWTSGVESFVKNVIGDKFSIIVNDPLEIAVFERLNQTIIECEEERHAYKRIKDYLLVTESSVKRTVIFTTDDYKLLSLYRFLMANTDLDLRTMKGTMSSYELKTVQEEWKYFKGQVKIPILLISDEVLGTNDIVITGAHSLFHLDINRSKFALRLNCLHDKFEKLTFFTEECGKQSDKRNCYSYMFLCPQNMELADCNFLYKFLGRCNVNRPRWLQEKAIDCVVKLEKAKGMNDVCSRIKSYGECKLPACDKRHLIRPDTDRPLLPNKGNIKFRLLHMESPDHFYIRIIEHKTLDNTASDYQSNYLEIKRKLATYLNDSSNVHGVNPRSILPGLIACIKMKDLTERVLVLDNDRHASRRPKHGYVFVKLIDSGEIKQIEQNELLQLSPELIHIPAQAIEVYLVGIRPLDSDDSYPEEAVKYTKNFLKDRDLYALIIMCIGSTLWVDTISQEIHFPKTGTKAYDQNLSLELIEQNFAEKNCNHVQKLIRLCSGKLDIWRPTIIKNSSQLQENTSVPIMRKFTYEPTDMHFEELRVRSENDDDYTPIKSVVSKVYGANLIFMTLESNINQIHRMEAEITELVQYIETLPIISIIPGTILLYPHEDYWLRGYVLEKYATNGQTAGGNNKIKVFSLDWGYIENLEISDQDTCLKKLPTEYQELPCQAILCVLHYCKHSPDSYSNTLRDAIVNFCGGASKEAVKESLELTCYTKLPYREANMIKVSSNGDTEDSKSPLSYTSSDLPLFKNIQAHSVEISKSQLPYYDIDLVLHERLIQTQQILPNNEWVTEVLPESRRPIGRVSRSKSVPHLVADFLQKFNQHQRIELAKMVEEQVHLTCLHFDEVSRVNGPLSEDLLNSLCIAIHFVVNPQEFMPFIRSIKYMVNLTQNSTLEMHPLTETAQSMQKKLFDIRYIGAIVTDYHSVVFSYLRLLEIVIRQKKRPDVSIFIQLLYRLLGGSETFILDVLKDPEWYDILSGAIPILGKTNEKDSKKGHSKIEASYELLMTTLVQLVSLYSSNEEKGNSNYGANKFDAILIQTVDVLLTESPFNGPNQQGQPWESSISLLLLIVGQRQYWPLIKQLDLFPRLLHCLLEHFEHTREWLVGLDEAVELLTVLWNHQRRSSYKNRLPTLADRVHIACNSDERAKHALSSLLAEMRIENSRKENFDSDKSTQAGADVKGLCPEEDAADWLRGDDPRLIKKQEISYSRLFQDENVSTVNEGDLEDYDKSNEDDEENSDVPVDDFFKKDLNPADEDNINCFHNS